MQLANVVEERGVRNLRSHAVSGDMRVVVELWLLRHQLDAGSDSFHEVLPIGSSGQSDSDVSPRRILDLVQSPPEVVRQHIRKSKSIDTKRVKFLVGLGHEGHN